MPKKGRAAKALIKYGPLVYAAAQRYGPVVWEQVRTHKEPVEKFAQATVARGNQRKKAVAHARTLKEGSVLQVFHHNEEHWVVFTGDRPTAVHPASDTSYEVLLQDADLDRRIYPTQGVVSVRVGRSGGSARPAKAPKAPRGSTASKAPWASTPSDPARGASQRALPEGEQPG